MNYVLGNKTWCYYFLPVSFVCQVRVLLGQLLLLPRRLLAESTAIFCKWISFPKISGNEVWGTLKLYRFELLFKMLVVEILHSLVIPVYTVLPLKGNLGMREGCNWDWIVAFHTERDATQVYHVLLLQTTHKN